VTGRSEKNFTNGLQKGLADISDTLVEIPLLNIGQFVDGQNNSITANKSCIAANRNQIESKEFTPFESNIKLSRNQFDLTARGSTQCSKSGCDIFLILRCNIFSLTPTQLNVSS
jgi:hypothetical protein